ncbi:hypothetical protein ASPZODRAFT_13850 [Penicilliopsis zonata CBS 506.65]|uniref:RanBD1 domain-containing protein n=1 Tax=Penicilliopsis zonata CBS 506.65 TaxID=1073090 RepID=A0A1L9SPV4_9EURO|nr:hypothetical protein ASPZODRAFT_13850 [Penicilliopsis zonata CBS 506.65]OJJ49113.1 hypothetical protein ASPZODRAFT_13850 [Penicilliopsis zonata CBS 506.65]
MSSTPDEKPQRATAAQLASRKIKEVRKRRPGTASGSAPPSSPFSSIDPNTVSSTSAAPQSSISNGFSFGQSQSFPGANSSSTPAAQNGSSPFSFGTGSGGGNTSSFNFTSSSFGGNSAAVSNPFASINTGASAANSTNGFTGFQGNMFNIPSSGSQAPAQQPLPTGGLFGAQPTTTTTTPAIPAATGSIFGQAATSSAAPSTNIFGQSSTTASTFGSPKAPTGFSVSQDSMQTSPDPKANKTSSMFGNGTATAPKINFGGSSSFTAPSTPSTSTTGTGLFGTSSESKPAFSAASSTPSQPLFGAKPAATTTAPAAPSLFGTTTSAPPATAPAVASGTTTTTTPSLFGNLTPAKSDAPVTNPFQSTNLFAGVSTPLSQTPQQKLDTEKPSDSAAPKSGFQPAVSTPGGTSLFSKSEATGAAPAPTGLFGAKPAFGASQPAPTNNMFAPKPAAAPAAPASTPAATPSNPFGSLFVPKPSSPAPSPAPSAAPTQEKPQASQGPFASLFSPKPATPAPMFSAPTPAATAEKPTNLFAQAPSSPLAAPPSMAKTKAVSSTVDSTPLAAPPTAKVDTIPAYASSMLPSVVPNELDEFSKKQFEQMCQIRKLNEGFHREITQLDPSKDSLDKIILFYLRVRETIGMPVGSQFKRKPEPDEQGTADEDGHTQKRIKSTAGITEPSSSTSSLNIAPSSITSTPSKLFGASETTPSNKRKAQEEEASDATPSGKRTKDADNSTTANIFAQSFSKSPAAETTPKTDGISTKTALFSSAPAASPAKPLFSASPVAKPAFEAAKPSSAPVANPFTLKPTGASAAAPVAGLPKFGAPIDFMAQFKKQADKDAEKEKEKRKAEDFDSEEEDEAEWERRDAEEQKKKREQTSAMATKRAKFIPGKGFSFEEDNEADEAKKTDVPPSINGTASSTEAGKSVFEIKSKAPSAQSSNIFGHLSATPSDAEAEDDDADDNDTDAASEDTAPKNGSFFIPSAEHSDAESRVFSSSFAGGSANESSDDGDITRAIKKKSTTTAEKTTADTDSANGSATPLAALTPSGGRSLFDRIQYDDAGKPKRDAAEDKNIGGLFGSSKFASSFNTPGSTTPNPFTPNSRPPSAQGEASGSSSVFGGLFNTPAPAAAESGTASGSDHTWKINSPIKFGGPSAPTSAPKTEGEASAAAPSAVKPFSTLFGSQTPSDTKSFTPSQQPSLGFSFGGPSQGTPSLFGAPTGTATPSRSTTPGIASDTGAEESADGDAAENLPQVDLSRGGAGEEDEDVVHETRARALKFKAGEGWESQGVGFLRILKNRNTSRGRILLRADPSGNVVLNTLIMKEVSYKVNGSGVHFIVPQADGKPEQWAVRVKKEETAKLAAVIEECKS